MPDNLVAIVALVMIFGGLPAIFWVVFSTIRRLKVARAQAEVHTRLIEKVGSTQDFLTFLGTDAGKKLVDSIGIEQPNRNPYTRILTSVQAGVILVLLGAAFLILAATFREASEGCYSVGVLVVALGAGFLISAGMSYRLSKSFGLFDREGTSGKLAA